MHQDAHAIHSEFIGVLCLDHAVSLAPVHQQRLVRKNTGDAVLLSLPASHAPAWQRISYWADFC